MKLSLSLRHDGDAGGRGSRSLLDRVVEEAFEGRVGQHIALHHASILPPCACGCVAVRASREVVCDMRLIVSEAYSV